MDSITGDQLLPVLQKYVQEVEKELDTRWESWSIDLSHAEKYEVIGALLARMVTLATELAVSPQIWNEHIAPVLLRTMVDAYITLAWIFNDPLERSRKFLLYGLGQAKLSNEHRKAQLLADGIDPQNDPVVKATEGWINSQRYLFLTEVNLGNWAGINTRKMAEEAGCIDLYNYVYTSFSAATHNMWHHIGRYNLKACLNPLHGLHYVPVDYQLPSHITYLRLAAKYTDKAFKLFNEKTGIKPMSPTSYEILLAELKTIEKPEEWTQSSESIPFEKE